MTAIHDAARFWDRHAAKYAAAPIKDMAGYDTTLARVRTRLDGMGSVLEIGCGTGSIALQLAPSVGRLVATDLSPQMIAIAEGKARAGAVTNVSFRTAAAEDAVGEPGSFDAVLAFSLLHLVEDRAAVLDRVFRSLKPGGVFISKTPCLSEMNLLVRLAVPVMRGLRLAPPVDIFAAAELEADIVRAGFTIAERGRHGSSRKDFRIFLVAHRPERG